MELPQPGPAEPFSGSPEFNMALLPAVEKTKPEWFDDIPWERSADFEVNDEALHSLKYMSLIEGHVCSGYLHVALASPEVRARTEATDFIGSAWGPQENWHGISLFRFRDQYEGRSESTRAQTQDQMRREMGLSSTYSGVIAGMAGAAAPRTFAAIYASMGYRNELMTMRGYGSLLGKVNDDIGERHPVLDPLLRNIMREESDHAQYYKRLATEMLEGDDREARVVRNLTRRASKRWWGIVGENFGGRDDADRVVRYLFSNNRGNEIAKGIDRDFSQLPGLEGLAPTQQRVKAAFAR